MVEKHRKEREIQNSPLQIAVEVDRLLSDPTLRLRPWGSGLPNTLDNLSFDLGEFLDQYDWLSGGSADTAKGILFWAEEEGVTPLGVLGGIAHSIVRSPFETSLTHAIALQLTEEGMAFVLSYGLERVLAAAEDDLSVQPELRVKLQEVQSKLLTLPPSPRPQKTR